MQVTRQKCFWIDPSPDVRRNRIQRRNPASVQSIAARHTFTHTDTLTHLYKIRKFANSLIYKKNCHIFRSAVHVALIVSLKAPRCFSLDNKLPLEMTAAGGIGAQLRRSSAACDRRVRQTDANWTLGANDTISIYAPYADSLRIFRAFFTDFRPRFALQFPQSLRSTFYYFTRP